MAESNVHLRWMSLMISLPSLLNWGIYDSHSAFRRKTRSTQTDSIIYKIKDNYKGCVSFNVIDFTYTCFEMICFHNSTSLSRSLSLLRSSKMSTTQCLPPRATSKSFSVSRRVKPKLAAFHVHWLRFEYSEWKSIFKFSWSKPCDFSLALFLLLTNCTSEEIIKCCVCSRCCCCRLHATAHHTRLHFIPILVPQNKQKC